MKEKEYAVVALKDILARALGAVQKQGFAKGYDAVGSRDAIEVAATRTEGGQVNIRIDGQLMLRGWDLEFARMSRDEQTEWLLKLFGVLIEHG